jgi:VWFA-related protein
MAQRSARLVLLVLISAFSSAQTSPYLLPVHVDEVDLTFSASDQNGSPINDLQLSDLQLLDNGKKPARILDFQHRTNRAIRAGILLDTSPSIGNLRRNQQIATLFSKLLQQNFDQAFVMRFDFGQSIRQDWTTSLDDLLLGIRHASDDASSRIGGTALFDSLYITCRDKFEHPPPSSTGTSNVLMLFTDGIDNVSHARLEDVIDICQRTQTAIYAFSEKTKATHDSGQKTLQNLTVMSGGRIFYDHGTQQDLVDLQILERDLRSDYFVISKPAKLTADGAFHRIELKSPYRASIITTRSGYYAPH